MIMRSAVAERFSADIFRHRIGEDDVCGESQLPDPERLCPVTKFNGIEPDFSRLGAVLAESFLCMLRAGGRLYGGELFDTDGLDMTLYLDRFRSEGMRCSFSAHFEILVQIALLKPELLPEVCKRLDALNNVILEERCWTVFCWEPVGHDKEGFPIYFNEDGIFTGLLR